MNRPHQEQVDIRDDVFKWFDERRADGAYEYSRAELINCMYRGERIPLLDTGRGIRNPADFDSTLTSSTTTP